MIDESETLNGSQIIFITLFFAGGLSPATTYLAR
jgi:hypothetical protein